MINRAIYWIDQTDRGLMFMRDRLRRMDAMAEISIGSPGQISFPILLQTKIRAGIRIFTVTRQIRSRVQGAFLSVGQIQSSVSRAIMVGSPVDAAIPVKQVCSARTQC